MAQWAMVIAQPVFDSERLFHSETVDLSSLATMDGPVVGDEVLLVVDPGAPRAVAVGRVVTAPEPAGSGSGPDGGQAGPGGALVVAYTRRFFDAPLPVRLAGTGAAVSALTAAQFGAVVDRLGPPAERSTWLVSVDLPIEASSPAEAVRQFWSYVMELGPRELPAFVWPTGRELAMQAYVLGAQANLDPEEDDD